MCEKLSKLSAMQGLLRPGARFSASAPKHALVLGHRESKTALKAGKSSKDVIRDVGFRFANRRRKKPLVTRAAIRSRMPWWPLAEPTNFNDKAVGLFCIESCRTVNDVGAHQRTMDTGHRARGEFVE